MLSSDWQSDCSLLNEKVAASADLRASLGKTQPRKIDLHDSNCTTTLVLPVLKALETERRSV